MYYNRKHVKKDLDKKILRKVKKNWIVVASATFMVLGTGALLQSKSINVSADGTNTSQTTGSSINSSTNNSSAAITQNSADSSNISSAQSNSSASNVSAAQSSASISGASDAQSAQTSSVANSSLASSFSSQSNVSSSSQTSEEQLKWGTANATYDKDTKTLTVTSGDNNTVGVLPQDGTQGDINFKGEVEKLVIAKPVKLAANAQWVFGNFTNLKDIEGLSNVNASDAVYMDGLFAQDKYLTSIDVSGWNTSKVVSMNSMFLGAKSVQTINLAGIDTSKVQNMYAMFAHDYSLTNVIGINNLDYSNVTTMKYWFAEDKSLTNLDLSGVYAPNVNNIDFMFLNTINLQTLNMAKFTTQNVTSGKAFWFIIEDPQFNFDNRNDPSVMVSHLVSFIIGPNFDTNKILFESFGGNRKSVKLGSDGFLTQIDYNQYSSELDNNTSHYTDEIKDYATKLWRGRIIKFVDVSNNQQVGSTLVAQGLVIRPTVVPIPEGYKLVDPNGNVVNFSQNDTLDTTQVIRIGKPVNFVVNLVDSNNNVVATNTFDGILGQPFDVASLLPSGYHFVGSSSVTPNEEGQVINVHVNKDESNNNNNSNNNNSNNNTNGDDPIIDDHQNNKGNPKDDNPSVDKHQHEKGKDKNDTPGKDVHQTKPNVNKHGNLNNKDNKSQSPKTDSLPQTGEANESMIQLGGLILLLTSLTFGFLGIKKKK